MMKSKTLTTILLLIIVSFFLTCDNATKPKDQEFNKEVVLSGAIQKGPFLNGTSVQITELEKNLIPTGKNFSSQIENNAGLFQLPAIQFSSQYVELKADGYYYNEIANVPSTSPITLYALSDITNKTTVNANIFTTLERPRVKNLMGEGSSFNAAKKTVYQEIINIFNFPEDSLKNSEDLDISSDGKENAKLLSMSLILQGHRTEAELSELVSNISFDIQEDGILNSTSLGSKLINDARLFDLQAIRQNLESRYSDLGSDFVIPNFEEYIDQFVSNTTFEITNIIEYPASYEGKSNILNQQVDIVPSDTDRVMYAILPRGTSLKVIITSLTSNTWFFEDSETSGFSWGDYINGSRTFTSTRTGELILIVRIVGPTKVEVYENNEESPSFVKEMTMEKVTDIDGNIYPIVYIGDQAWLGENLKVTHYRNGDPIPNITDNTEWNNLTTGAYCNYDNNANNATTYGRLYNWYAVNDSRNIAPEGWHVPSDAEWQTLIDYLGGSSSGRGGKMKEAGTTHWNSPNTGATNESGFSALPGGNRGHWGDEDSPYYYFGNLGRMAFFWSPTESGSNNAFSRLLYCDISEISRNYKRKRSGFSVRCVGD